MPVNAYNAGVNEDNRLHKFEDYTWYELTGTPSRTQVTNSSPALLRVGGDLTIKGNGAGTGAGNNTSNSALTNKDSQIIVGGDVHLSDIALSNQETKGTYRVQYDGTAQWLMEELMIKKENFNLEKFEYSDDLSLVHRLQRDHQLTF